MNITIFGTGYVGLITGVCFADIGHHVICVDIDTDKIKSLQDGIATIYEPGLNELLVRNIAAKRIGFTTEEVEAIKYAEVQFIAVGTPEGENGAADLQYVYAVAKSLGQYLERDSIIINKSTVPVGTADQVKEIIQSELSQRNQKINFSMVSNPEFLKQGDAINDFMQGARIVVGCDNEKALSTMQLLYKPLIDKGQEFIAMNISSAELTKYAANAFLANKISFINEISHLAGKVGADVDHIRIGIGSDPRIGKHFLQAGCGYGGSCFPKDVKALINIAANHQCETPILNAVEAINSKQKQILFQGLQEYFANNLAGKTIALWGLAFKPNTDDMREASSRVLLKSLWQAGSKVQAYDPVAMPMAKRLYGARDDLILSDCVEDTLQNADALVIVTEWNDFKTPDFDLIKQQLSNPVIFDGRNLFNPKTMAELGIDYYSIGRYKSL
jgi:UDPglucose 6-dehydrogenase